MLYDLCSDLLTYIQAVGLAWVGVVGFSVPFAVNEMLNQAEWYRSWAKKFAHPVLRRLVLFSLLLTSVFWAGFLTWRDEHTAKIAAESKLDQTRREKPASQMSRMTLSGIMVANIVGDQSKTDLFINITNKGLSASLAPVKYINNIITDHKLSGKESDKWITDLYATLNDDLDWSDRNEFGVGILDQITIPDVLTADQYEKIKNCELFWYVSVFLIYPEAEDPTGQKRLTEFCFSLVRGTETMETCNNHNRTIKWPR